MAHALGRQANMSGALARFEAVTDEARALHHERICRELQDGAIQRLFAVGLDLQSSAQRIDDEGFAQRLQDNVADIDQVISDLRTCILGLRHS